MRIRTQLALVVSVVVALVVALAGLLAVVRDDRRTAREVDRVLAARVATVRAAAQQSGALPTDGSYVVRLLDGGKVRRQAGSQALFPLPARAGYSTVTAAGTDWRSLTETLVTGAQLQVLVSLAEPARRHTDNVLLVDLLVVLAALLSAAGVWFATGQVLRPYQRLAEAARRLDPADPGSRLPDVGGPREVAELAGVIDRLHERARAGAPALPDTAPGGPLAAAPRALTSDSVAPQGEAPLGPTAGSADPVAEAPRSEAPRRGVPQVEVPVAELRPPLDDLRAALDKLLDNPELPATQRHLLLAAMADDHRRLVTLLEALRPAEIKDLP